MVAVFLAQITADEGLRRERMGLSADKRSKQQNRIAARRVSNEDRLVART
jgi:hypothetical protein